MNVRSFLSAGGKPGAAIFMSGSGSNAEKLLEYGSDAWRAVAIVTDAPRKSRAVELSERHGLPLVALDISAYYRERGEEKVTLFTERGRLIREEWTNELRGMLAPFRPDFGILAGFVPLSNITSDFPCLNVHPGDLTYERDGRRVFVGLHTIPVEKAILEGVGHLRSSVILAQPYTGSGGEMDSGPVLGISEEVGIDFMGLSPRDLAAVFAKRPARRPPGGFKDALEEVASHNQELLKRRGDWVIFPRAVEDFALGNFGMDADGRLVCRVSGQWRRVKTVVYGEGGKTPLFV